MSQMHAMLALAALGASLLGACASVPSETESDRSLAKVKLDIGDYPEALQLYGGLAADESGSDAQRAFDSLQKGKCLYYLGRYDEALACFVRVVPEELDLSDPEDQQTVEEAWLLTGRCEVGLARQAESPFLPDTPERRSEIERRSAQAVRHYEKAQIAFERILDELNPSDFEALLAVAECFFRQGLLNHSNQYFYKARTHLDRCLATQPDDARVRFLDGRLIQEDLGRGALTSDAGERVIRAMLTDAAGNHDFHVAYRDMLVYMRRFPEPPDVENAFRDANDEESQKRKKHLLMVIDLLRDYSQSGTPSSESWVTDARRELAIYIDHYDNFGRETRGTERNIARASEVARDTTGDNLSSERFRAAMTLLKEVPKQFIDREDYKSTRRIVQTAYVESLLRDADDLVRLGEWGVADQTIREAQASSGQVEYLIHGESASEGYISHAQRLNDQRSLLERWQKEEQQIRQQIDEGRIDQAKDTLRLAIDGVKPTGRTIVQAKIDALAAEIETAVTNEMRRELAQSWQRAQTQSDVEALKTLESALAVAEANRCEHWRVRLERQIAWVNYRLGDYDKALAGLSRLAGDGDAESEQSLDERDRFLGALCLFRRGQVGPACVRLDSVNTAVVKDDGELKLVGLAYLQNDQPGKAEFFLTKIEKKDAETILGLKECYLKLVTAMLQSDQRDVREAQRSLNQLLKLDPKNARAHLELGLLCYDQAKADQSLDRYREAYEHIMLARAGKDGQPRNDAERACVGRLTACFSDYLPLGVGRKWEYGGPSGEARTIEVMRQDADGKYEVKITETIGGKTGARTERWIVEGGMQRRFDAAAGARVDVPVRIRYPENETLTVKYDVIATTYTAQVVATGVTVKEENAGTWSNCLQVRLLCDNQTKRDVYFAPGIGEVKSVETGIGTFVLKGSPPPQARGDSTPSGSEVAAAR